MNPKTIKTVAVVQGEFKISSEPEVVLSTVLGSCVAVCLHDPGARIGGMNHFLLPHREGSGRDDIRYGAHAMELLINGLLKDGAARHRLEAKIFGGASMASHLQDIGSSNAAFAHQFLADESIPILSESLGGTLARRVRFWPESGRVQQMLIPSVIGLEENVQPATNTKSDAVTLF